MPSSCARPSFMLTLLIASSASAVPVDSAIDGFLGLWQEFAWFQSPSFVSSCTGCGASGSPGNSEWVGAPPWTFTSQDPVILTVTSAFGADGQFEIFNFGSAIGETSAVPRSFHDCGNDPAVCVRDPLVSTGIFDLAPGSYSLTIEVLFSFYSYGASYFRLDSVPEPGTGLLVFAGLLALARWRRARA